MKAPALFREYIWLVRNICQAKAISLSEINARWIETDMSEGVPFSRTTFNRHKDAIQDIFGIIIDCDRRNGYKYYIANEEVLQTDSVQNWMLSTISVSNLLSESLSLQHRILLENVPSGGRTPAADYRSNEGWQAHTHNLSSLWRSFCHILFSFSLLRQVVPSTVVSAWEIP